MLLVLSALLSASPHTGTLKKELIDNALQAQLSRLEACLEWWRASSSRETVA
ncbi:MAG: hypothetical protein JNM69_01140 [Archangium sp.]|nr:hypothetical protein [Archangium sp.]